MKGLFLVLLMAFSMAAYSVPTIPSEEGPSTEIVQLNDDISFVSIDAELHMTFEKAFTEGSINYARIAIGAVDRLTVYLNPISEDHLEKPLEPPLNYNCSGNDKVLAEIHSFPFKDILINPGWRFNVTS